MRRLAPLCLALAIAAGPATAAEPLSGPAAIQLRPAPPAAATRELMRRWHRTYRQRLSPVLEEWAQLARTARRRPGRHPTASCRRLELALAELRRRRLPVAPDPSVSLHLEETLRSLSDAAGSCTHGAYFLTAWRLSQADASWRELRGRLLLYGLAP